MRKRKIIVDKIEVAKAMMYYGGSFVNYLVEALLRADASNTKKIKRAFSKYWKTYYNLAKTDLENERDLELRKNAENKNRKTN